MKTYNNLWQTLCSKAHLYNAFLRARKRKTKKIYVQEFESNLEENLFLLRAELVLHVYHPQPLTTFVIRDPKTRVISKSSFRDRIVHHALVSLLEPIFDKSFIFDSYANRKGKGTLKAWQRFNVFKRKRDVRCVLKADIAHYFDEVSHEKLLEIIGRTIKDNEVLWLIKIILGNHNIVAGKGMPLGNLTSQFFANVYLNELDQFVKHQLRIRWYIRYVDDFVIFGSEKALLKRCQVAISCFLRDRLRLRLHEGKSKVRMIQQGIAFLGLRIFWYHCLLRKVNIRKMFSRLDGYKIDYGKKFVLYDQVYNSFEGWSGYAKHADTYKFRIKVWEKIESLFPGEISSVEVNRYLKTCY